MRSPPPPESSARDRGRQGEAHGVRLFDRPVPWNAKVLTLPIYRFPCNARLNHQTLKCSTDQITTLGEEGDQTTEFVKKDRPPCGSVNLLPMLLEVIVNKVVPLDSDV